VPPGPREAPPDAVLAPRAAILVIAAGCALLAARPILLPGRGDPTAALVGIFIVLLAAGGLWPLTEPTVRPGPVAAGLMAVGPVLAVGLAAFGLGRLVSHGAAPLPFTSTVVALNTLAAVAEEAFFRRLVYGALAHHSPVLAGLGSAVLFAAVHVTVYGAWVLPLDLAAGLVLSWQRWATGSWAVPAVTHVVANLLVVL
jgi:membrane protease YdiL (CAAX protease family)